MTKAQTKSGSRGGGTGLYIPVAALLVLFACIMGVSVFLRVSAVEVRGGGGKYTPEELIQAAGISKGDNLLFLNVNGVEEKLKAEMPYIESVEVRPRFPDTVVIEFTESVPVAFVYASGGVGWLINARCRVLGTLSAASGDYAGLIRVDGITPVDPVPGDYLSLGDIPGSRLAHLEQALKALVAAGIAEDVESIDISNIATISFKYLGRFDVVLGGTEQAEEKLALLIKTVAGLDENAAKKINLSEPGIARMMDTA